MYAHTVWKCVLLCALALLWFPLTDFVKDFVAPAWDRKSEQVQHITTSGLVFLIPLVERGNRFIAAAVTIWPLTNLMWQRGGGWGESEGWREGRGERRHTQKSRDERWREKAMSFHKDADKQLALSVITPYLAGKITFSCCGSHFIQETLRRSERKTDFLWHKCALLRVRMWTDCAWNITFSSSSLSKVAPDILTSPHLFQPYQ